MLLIDTFTNFQISTLIMTFLTFCSADIFHSHTIHLLMLKIIPDILINRIKFIPAAVIITEIHFCLAVTVDAPAHA